MILDSSIKRKMIYVAAIVLLSVVVIAFQSHFDPFTNGHLFPAAGSNDVSTTQVVDGTSVVPVTVTETNHLVQGVANPQGYSIVVTTVTSTLSNSIVTTEVNIVVNAIPAPEFPSGVLTATLVSLFVFAIFGLFLSRRGPKVNDSVTS